MNFHTQSSHELTRRITSLFGVSKKWRGWMETLPNAPHEQHVPMINREGLAQVIRQSSAADVERKVRNHTTRQLCLSLQMQAGDEHTKVILDSLTQLVEANEISFSAYVNKLDHLYPEQMKLLDVHLKSRITSLLNHSN